MPPTPVPPEVDEFLRKVNPAVVATVRPDGSPHTAATWYDWDGDFVLLNMDETRVRLGFMRRDPRISLTVLDADSWYRHVTLMGRVERIEEDSDLADIDRLSTRYTGRPFGARDAKRFSAWLRPERWYAWD